MIAVNQDELIEQTTTAALEEKAKLKKHFGRFDMLFFLICTLVGLDTLGAVASNGAQGFTWLAFLAVVFFVPYALLTAELGSTFTEEGGSYIWVKLAFGRFVAAIRSVLYRIPWGNTGVWVCGVLCTLWSALATVALLYPGFGTSNPDDSLPDGWAGQRGAYELSQFIPLAVLIGLGHLFYWAGRGTRAQVAEVNLPSLADQVA